jgi:type IV pilus assembly protein PilM
MTQVSFAERFRHLLMNPRYPDVGIEFSSDCIRLAVSGMQRGKPVLTHLDREPLPPGAIEISPFKPNILAIEPVANALKNLWSRNRNRPSRVSLLLQDRAALTFNVVLEHPAKSASDCLELIRFKLKKSVPFRIEDAQVTYFNASGVPEYTAASLWAVVLNHEVLHQYEQFVESTIDVACGLVDLATFNFMNLAHAEIRNSGLKDEDIFYVNLGRDTISVAISQKQNLMFFRSRALETTIDDWRLALPEIHPAMLYYVDKLGGQSLSRAFVHAETNSEELSEEIQKQFGVTSSMLPLQQYTGMRFDTSKSVNLQPFVPLVGLLITRKAEF